MSRGWLGLLCAEPLYTPSPVNCRVQYGVTLHANCAVNIFKPVQAHGVLMVVAWVFILPISVAIARTCKGFRTPLWFHLHRALGVRPGPATCTSFGHIMLCWSSRRKITKYRKWHAEVLMARSILTHAKHAVNYATEVLKARLWQLQNSIRHGRLTGVLPPGIQVLALAMALAGLFSAFSCGRSTTVCAMI